MSALILGHVIVGDFLGSARADLSAKRRITDQQYAQLSLFVPSEKT